MIYKALREKTKDIFQWGVVAEDVYDKKKNIWRKDWPVYGAFYRGWYCGYWYQNVFCVFEMLDGTDEEVWFDSDDMRECTKIKEVMDAIPTLNENAKLDEQFLKEVAIKQDFEDD